MPERDSGGVVGVRTMKKQIIASGGFVDTELMQYILDATGRPFPKIAFLGTASLDSPYAALDFYRMTGKLDCYSTDVFGSPDILLSQDAIFVGGGSTRDLMVLWYARRISLMLYQAYNQGVVLAGNSAGANCWFDKCVVNPVGGVYEVGYGMGILPGCFCPHYEDTSYHNTMLLHGKNGYACESGSALHFVDGKAYKYINGGMNSFHVVGGVEKLLL